MKTKLVIEMEIDLEIDENCTMKMSEIKKEIKTDIKSGCCGVDSGDYRWGNIKNVKILPKGYIMK